MSESDESTTDGLLRQLLVGEVSADAPEVRELFARDPAARVRFEELRELGDDLGDLADLEDEVVAESETSVGAPGEDAVRALILERVAEAGRAGRSEPQDPVEPRRSTRASAWPWLVAAAAVLALVVQWQREPATGGDGPPLPERPEVLLGGELQLLSPVGEVEAWGEFTWDHERPRGGHYAIEVADEAGRVLGSEERWTSTSWTPPDDVRRRFPSTIHWEVTSFDALGNQTGFARGEARLSSR